MRYRPFGRSGASVSALSLALTDEPMRRGERTKLIYAALEAGVNAFEIRSPNPEVALNLAEAVSAVERHMLKIFVRLGWTHDRRGDPVRDLRPDRLRPTIGSLLERTGFGYFDVAIMDVLDGETLPPHVVPDLHGARDDEQVRHVGVCGGASADPFIGKSDFDVLSTSFNLESGWGERHRVRGATAKEMPVIGSDFLPPSLGGKGLPPAYQFMTRTPGWSVEQICLAYSLTEPAISTIQTTTTDPRDLEVLVEAVERDLPSWLPAQIEMARFSNQRGFDPLANRRPEA